MTMTMTELAVNTQSWTVDRWSAISERLLPADTDDGADTVEATRLTAWVVLVGVMIIGATAAWAVCLNKGYSGFSGEIKLHTKWKIPVGIKLECF